MRWKGQYHPEWQLKFAWFPITLSDKTVIWLEHYRQRYVANEDENTRIVGHWEIEATS